MQPMPKTKTGTDLSPDLSSCSNPSKSRSQFCRDLDGRYTMTTKRIA